MVSDKLEFQCSKNGHQNLPYCLRSIQNTFIFYSSILHQQIFPKYSAHNKKLENRKPGSLTNQVKVSLLVSARTACCQLGLMRGTQANDVM